MPAYRHACALRPGHPPARLDDRGNAGAPGSRAGLHVTGPIPRITTFEDVGGPFFLDAAGAQPDPLVDDQALFFTVPEGVVVLLGCADAGVINTLHYIHKLTRGAPVHAVIGGMHLLNAPAARLAATIAALREFGVRCVAPCHCTGGAATDLLRSHFPGPCQDFGVGSRLVFDLP